MPELHFKGKEFVYNHHLTVPFRPLVPDPSKSCGGDAENLIIHGDNLHALKSLLPRYAGKVDLVFIDPPYNTGNEGWAYNDNVNSPMLKEWLDGNPVNGEDMLRHDKWLCMMWPRLKLLHELLSESGSIWITLDDNEIHHARAMLDEIFGEQNFVTQVEWQKRYTRSNNTDDFTSVIDHLIAYQKSDLFKVNLVPRDDIANGRFTNPDNDPRGPWKATPFLNQVPPEKRPNLCYPIANPNTGRIVMPTTKAWRNDRETYEKLLAENRFWWGAKQDKDVPDIKTYLSEVKDGLAPTNFWSHDFGGNTDDANREIKELFGDKVFDTPKPTQLLLRVLEHASAKESLVLDSYAGSGTTAHAVLAQNAKDGGNRKFIMVEGEDYADTLTAERIRRVINGYPFTGTQREELLREKITLTQLKKASQLLDKVALVEQQNAGRFDAVKSTVKDGELIVTGEKAVKTKADGLGGGFTYCTLGDKLEIDDLLTGKSLPSFEAFGGYLFHTATGQTLDTAKIREGDGYLGESAQYHVWLIYKPELDYLKSRDASLTLSLAERIAATDRKKQHLVFAPARFVPQKTLLELGVEHAPLPYALYRIEKA